MSLSEIKGSDSCPVCNSTDGRCRSGEDRLIVCRGCLDASGETAELRFIGLTKDGGCGQFALPRDEPPDPGYPLQSLTAEERDRRYRALLSQLTLHPDDRADLRRRGLTDQQIAAGLFRSVKQWQTVNGLPLALPGVLPGGRLNTGGEGYLCPVWNQEDLIVGLQLRLRHPEDGCRYRWLTSKTKKHPDAPTAHIDGQLPVTVARPLAGVTQPNIGIAEGILKPWIAAQKHGQVVIGAAGGNFGASRAHCKAALKAVSAKLGSKVIDFYPDAGSLQNKQVLRQYQASWELLAAWGYEVKIGWWGQIEKDQPDIDELDSLGEVQWLSPAEWLALSLKQPEKAMEPAASADPDREFPFTVVDSLYSKTYWICVSGRLHRWTGRGYEYQTDEQELKRIQQLAESISYFSEKKGREVFPYAKPSAVKNALEWLKIKFAVDPDQCNPPGVNCTNGVRIWNDRKGDFELLPHSPDRYYLYEPLATYDPEAPTEDCDRLLAALQPEQLQVLLRTVAAAIDLPLVRKRRGRGVRALLCRGVGSNGKDAHREAFSMLWGRSGCVSVAFEDFGQYDSGRKFPLAGLRTARINWASENNGSINLDRLQSLKKAITGDPLHFELKGQNHSEYTPNAVQIFNVNDIPRLGAAQEAIRSRFAVIDYSKIYRIEADESKGELKADPRLKYDPDFIQANILPALLNKVELAFKNLLAEGIDYSCTDAALEEIQSYNSHLWDFVRSVGLEPDPAGTVAVAEVWAALEDWYKATGVLEVETTNFNKEVRTWAEPVRSGDQFVKGANQIYKRLLDLFAGLKQFDLGGNRKGIKGLKFAVPATEAESEPEPAATAEPVQPIQLDSQIEPEPESVIVARYVIAFKQAAAQPVGFGEDRRLVQLIEELKPRPLEIRRAIWKLLPNELTRRIDQVLQQRPDLLREKVGG